MACQEGAQRLSAERVAVERRSSNGLANDIIEASENWTEPFDRPSMRPRLFPRESDSDPG
jgi:hypothetical protein